MPNQQPKFGRLSHHHHCVRHDIGTICILWLSTLWVFLLCCDLFNFLQMLGSKLSCDFQAVRTLLTFADFSHSCEVAIGGCKVFLQAFLMITDWRSPA